MIEGSCLCGGVRFAVEDVTGPFELCHCPRCRKSSGSAYLAQVGAPLSRFRWLQGEDLIQSFEAPIVNSPPSYARAWCKRCGSPAPFLRADVDWLEIPAGLFDSSLPVRPDRHIFVDQMASWDAITDSLPCLTRSQAMARHCG